MLAICSTRLPFLHDTYNDMPYFIFSNDFNQIDPPGDIDPGIGNQSLNARCDIRYNVVIYVLYFIHGHQEYLYDYKDKIIIMRFNEIKFLIKILLKQDAVADSYSVSQCNNAYAEFFINNNDTFKK